MWKVTTQSDRDRFFEPAVSAILLEKLDGKQRLSELERLVGTLGPEDSAFASVEAELTAFEQSAIFTRQGSD